MPYILTMQGADPGDEQEAPSLDHARALAEEDYGGPLLWHDSGGEWRGYILPDDCDEAPSTWVAKVVWSYE